jgi:hypothetical protein
MPDDVKLYKLINSAVDRVILQVALDALCAWAHLWELHISIDKCNFFQIGYFNLALVYCINSNVIAMASKQP